MKILVDTREQKDLKFKHPFVTEVVTTTLQVGDYGCLFKDGHISPVMFERKSVNDLFGTLGSGHKRFSKELKLSIELGIRLKIIIEGTFSDVIMGVGAEFSKMSPKIVIKQLFTIEYKYGVSPVFCKDRREMSKYILHTYCAEGRIISK